MFIYGGKVVGGNGGAGGVVVTQDLDVNEMGKGNFYFVKDTVDISDTGTVLDFLIVPPAGPVRIFSRGTFKSSDQFDLKIYRDAVVTDNGTAYTPQNCEQDSSNVAQCQFFVDPTVTDPGSQVWHTKIDQSFGGTIESDLNYQIILAASTNYILRVTKESSGTDWLDFDVFWYEEEL